MSNIARVAGQAANTLSKPLQVEDVFSTYLYEGNGSTQTITNGIDLAGEGGLVWGKARTTSSNHYLYDTERGIYNLLASSTTGGQANLTDRGVSAFNSDGFDIKGAFNQFNNTGQDYASWSFRKAPKFFDVVTYTGDGVAGREIPHNLGCAVGAMFIKRTDDSKYWPVYHRSTTATHFLRLNSTDAAQDSTIPFGDVEPTSTVFTVSGDEVVNTSGGTYVAYLFAHNNGDGEFGPDGDADIIKCGSYTGNGSATGPSVNLGFEPQWLLIRNVDRADDWVLIDAMRGIPSSSGGPAVLRPESSAVEYASGSTFSQASRVDLTATGFDVKSNNSRVNGSSQNMIYIAIRRGPMAVPESATDVFDVASRTGASGNQGAYHSGFSVDMAFHKVINNSSNPYEIGSRLTQGRSMNTNDFSAEVTQSDQQYDYMDGWNSETSASSTKYAWMWKRAPNFFDVVAYAGEGTKQTISHNLGVAPEMMWIKVRSATQHWSVYHPDLPGSGKFISLNNNWDGNNTNSTFWDGETPTSTTFSVGATGVNNNYVNGSPNTYIAYLFATLAGISKVGSVTHSGTTNVDCGFSSGARFVLLKRTDATGDWYVWDSERGIVSGNDPYLLLNTTAAEVTNTDLIDPLSSGFTITSSLTAGDYIFYAIA